MASQNRLVFINLPIRSLATSKAFFEKIGFEFDAKFTDETTGCLVIAENAAYAMLHEPSKWSAFAAKPAVDPTEASQLILAVSAESREAVDELADAALAAGGSQPREAQDYGFMYGRSFTDPDGHHWEVTWMSQEAVEAGPADFAQAD